MPNSACLPITHHSFLSHQFIIASIALHKAIVDCWLERRSCPPAHRSPAQAFRTGLAMPRTGNKPTPWSYTSSCGPHTTICSALDREALVAVIPADMIPKTTHPPPSVTATSSSWQQNRFADRNPQPATRASSSRPIVIKRSSSGPAATTLMMRLLRQSMKDETQCRRNFRDPSRYIAAVRRVISFG